MVTEGSSLADVGTDHGYIPIALVQTGKVSRAIAMDINKGPLERAALHIREQHLEDRITTRLSDGMTALKEGEADTVLIAGMGGALTVHILEGGAHCLASVKELILQPQSEIWLVREWLCEHGYKITDEDIVLDEGKIAGLGTHQELLESCEVYRQIAASQLSESELENQGKSRDSSKMITDGAGEKEVQCNG